MLTLKFILGTMVCLTTAITFSQNQQPTCLTSKCHSDLIEKKYLHGPIKSKECVFCHQVLSGEQTVQKNGKSFTHARIQKMSAIEINKKCFVCHEEYKAKIASAQKVHSAINEKSCVGCHNPHQADRSTLLNLDSKKDLCLSCHKNIEEKLKTAKYHMIDGMKKQCLTCHETHTSTTNSKLIAAKQVLDLCLSCHNKPVKRTNGSMLASFNFNSLNAKSTHKPVIEQSCLKCHDIHGSPNSLLLVHEYKKENPALCYSCHEMKNTQFRNGFGKDAVDLHELHLKLSKNKKSCQTCHDPHQSLQNHLIKPEFETRGHKFNMIYKSLETGGTCTTVCHKTFEYSRSAKVQNASDR